MNEFVKTVMRIVLRWLALGMPTGGNVCHLHNHEVTDDQKESHQAPLKPVIPRPPVRTLLAREDIKQTALLRTHPKPLE